VVVALGSNLGDRLYNLRRAVAALGGVMRVVRISSVHETAPVDAPAGSPPFLNMTIVGYTRLDAPALLAALHAIEFRLGRIRRRVRNEPRIIDLDLIVHGATRIRSESLTLPHPRAYRRAFVIDPLKECSTVVVDFLKRAYDVAPA
jgi:2-amino-4-hydroxy-6-hydroxymethyldihydropteridine diphosphokinase